MFEARGYKAGTYLGEVRHGCSGAEVIEW